MSSLIWSVVLLLPEVSTNEYFFDTNSINEGLLPSCATLRKQYDEDERLSYAPFPPDISGHWISQKCEIRPGPEYVIRSYQFSKNNTFKMMQFFYGEPSCSLPLYSLLAKGTIDAIGPSWAVPGGLETDYTLQSVKVIPYTMEIAEEILFKINSTCPDQSLKRHWKPHHQYSIYNYSDDEESAGNVTDFDCLHSVHAVFNEAQLIRLVKKPSKRGQTYSRANYNMKSYLYLGDIYPVPEGRFAYRPTSYQTPLISIDDVAHCQTCLRIARSSIKIPPKLHAIPADTLQLTNEWMSSECETMPVGTFLKRRYKFNEIIQGKSNKKRRTSTWAAEVNYFSDPSCLHSTYTTYMQGTYAVGRESTIQNVRSVDFIVTSTVLTAHDRDTVVNLNGHIGNVCGRQGSWVVGVPQELAKTNGCQGLGITLPRRVQSLMKTERDSRGYNLLYLGFSEAVDESVKAQRPTSLHPSLINCRVVTEVDQNNELNPLPFSMSSLSFASTVLGGNIFVILLPVLFWL